MGYITTFILNGDRVELDLAPTDRLIDVLRDRLFQTGTKESCGQGLCGVCSVVVDGTLRFSCLTLAVELNGSEVLTVERLASDGELHPLQRAFISHGGFQCGFCTSGHLMSAYALLSETPLPTRDQVRGYMNGNLCRCTGYYKIVESVIAASRVCAQDIEQDEV